MLDDEVQLPVLGGVVQNQVGKVSVYQELSVARSRKSNCQVDGVGGDAVDGVDNNGQGHPSNRQSVGIGGCHQGALSVLHHQRQGRYVGVCVVRVPSFGELQSVEPGSCGGILGGQSEVGRGFAESDGQGSEGQEGGGEVADGEGESGFEVGRVYALSELYNCAVVALLDSDDVGIGS